MAIHEGAIDLLISAYKRSLPEMDGYICENGSVCAFQSILCVEGVLTLLMNRSTSSASSRSFAR